jgi:hypothetical protein
MGYNRSDLLIEEIGTYDGSGAYASAWAETSGYGSALVLVYNVLADSPVWVNHGFPSPPDAFPGTFLPVALAVSAYPTGGFIAFGEVPLYMRYVQVSVTGAAADGEIVISVRGR